MKKKKCTKCGQHMKMNDNHHPKEDKVAIVMEEFSHGKLRSGFKKGPKVKNPKQAIAIALSEANKAKKKHKK